MTSHDLWAGLDPPALISWIYEFEKGTERWPPAPSLWAGSDRRPRGACFPPLAPGSANLGQEAARFAAPGYLCPQETSPLPAACWPERCSGCDCFLHPSVLLCRAEHHRDALGQGMGMPRVKGRGRRGSRDGDAVGQGTGLPAPAGTGACCRREESPLCSSSRSQMGFIASGALLAMGTSLQISMLVHPAATCAFGNRGRRQEPAPASTDEFLLWAKPANQYGVGSLRENYTRYQISPHRDKELRAVGGEHAVWESQSGCSAPRAVPGERRQREALAGATAASRIAAGKEMLNGWILHPSLWLLEYLHKPQCALNPTTKSSQRAINILIPVAS